MVDAAIGMPRATRRLLAGLMLAVGATEGLAGSSDAHSPSGATQRRDDQAQHAARMEALVTLAQQGDAEAFGQIYDRYVDQVYRYVYVRTGNREAAEDITSETFLRALRRIDSFTWQGRDIVAWFITIARNIVIDQRTSARFRLEVPTAELLQEREADDGEMPEQAVIRGEGEVALVEALRVLTPEQAECVVLRFMEGLSIAECAEILGRRENAIKQLQLRAIRALRRELSRAD